MPGQHGPARSLRILNRHRHAGQSSSASRSVRIRGGAGPGSVAGNHGQSLLKRTRIGDKRTPDSAATAAAAVAGIFPRLYEHGEKTYARQLGAAVTAFRGRSTLLDVKSPQVAAGGLDDPRPVGRCVVAGNVRILQASISAREKTVTYGLRRR